jgi:CPA1 family monovalent cation:H+ antiporter
VALAAAVSGTFSLPRAGAELLFTGAGGIAVGLATAWCVGWVRLHLKRSSVVENTVSLLSPFIAFIPANELGCSGVLAVITMGLFLGRRGPRVVSAPTRLQGTSMWEMLSFLLEGLIFILIGLQLPQVVRALDRDALGRLVEVSIVVTAAMIVTRIVWMFVGAYAPRWIQKRLGRADTAYPPWRHVLFLGWAGIRGGDSLVIALALPYAAVPGAPPEARAVLIFITFVVILITLVVQGLTLTPVIRLLGIVGGNEEQTEERTARSTSLQAGAAALEQLTGAEDERDIAAALRRAATYRLERLNSGYSTPPTYARLTWPCSQPNARR